MPQVGKGNRGRHRAGRSRRAWAAQVELVPEEAEVVPPIPMWPTYVAERGTLVLEEAPFFKKVNVEDFLDLEDPASIPDGDAGARWEFHDSDDFDDCEPPFFVKVDVRDFFDIEDLNSCTLLGPECFGTLCGLTYFEECGDLDEIDSPAQLRQQRAEQCQAIASTDAARQNRQPDRASDAEQGPVDILGEPRLRAKDIIWQDIRSMLERCPALQPEDFDYRVRQLLYAVYSKGGRPRMLSALEMIREAALQRPRTSVHSWPAYIAALLKKADLPSREREARAHPRERARREADDDSDQNCAPQGARSTSETD